MMRIIFMTVLLLHALPGLAQEEKSARQMGRKMYLSLTGVTPTTAELNLLQLEIEAGNAKSAATSIIDQRNGFQNHGAFYNATVKDMATPWTNKPRSTLEPLNDMTATIIGFIRDERPFNKILYEDSVYKATGVTFKGEMAYFQSPNYPSIVNAQAICQRDLSAADYNNNTIWKIIYNNPQNPNDPSDKKCRVTKFTKEALDENALINALYLPHLDLVIKNNLINVSNEHYQSISDQGLDLSDKRLLGSTSQEGKLHLYPQAIAGLLSTRAYGAAYLIAGTNRAAVAFAMEHFLCKDMEELNDTTIPDYRNRRDVDRSPGGTSEIYKNRCIGCHAGMDGLAGAFAYYDFNGKVTYTPGNVVTKMNHNVFFSKGFITQSDQWINLWVSGQNAALGWSSTTGGEGARSFGMMLSETQAFHSCMAKQVYQKVCMRPVRSTTDQERVKKLTAQYKADNYNMKNLFINASVECMGD